IHGFTVTKISNIDGGELVQMIHDKTAARLAWLDNGEENKLFCVSFKTVPYDDTGVFHILEHSVLGGSEKYPVKEPFLYLLKGSMNTFLNAMTFPDKTMFPVSSRNSRDFMNLTRVYLDAVFRPEIYNQPNIFYQEGHHIEWSPENPVPVYKGVVFNEMKGCFSSVDERIESGMMSILFPESCYRFEYGGNPESIPELTYGQFIEAHRKFYHPSNSYIYLDGSIDISSVLELIDSYLSGYERCTELPEIDFQPAVKKSVREEEYSVSAGDDIENQTYLAMGKVVANWREIEKITAYEVLADALTGSNDAPLMRALLDTELCLDASINVSDGIQQPFVMLKICSIDRRNGDILIEKVRETVCRLTSDGIGCETIKSALNRIEFRYRESEEPKGLTRCIDAMSSWLYGGDPADYIDYGYVFGNLREKAETGYFEKLLAEWLLDDDGLAVLYMIPSSELEEKERNAEIQRLNLSLDNMSDPEKKQLAELNRNLIEWQTAPDTPEAVSSLPELPLSEISPEPMEFITEAEQQNGFTVLSHPSKEGETVVVRLYFDVSDFSVQELKILSFMDRLICELPTKRSSGLELQQRINGVLGSLSTNISSFSRFRETDKCQVFFTVNTRFLKRSFREALELIGELLTETVYDYPELIRELLGQDEEDLKQDIISNGHSFAVRRAKSSMSAENAVREIVSGFESYRILHEMNKSGNECLAELISDIKLIAKKVFCKSRLTASIIASGKYTFDILADILPEGDKPERCRMSPDFEIPKKQGIIIPSGVSYTGVSLSDMYSDKAVWGVLSTILTYEYLWNEIRVKGGAYGTGCGAGISGEVSFYSYRDPSPKASITKYSEAADFLRRYCESRPDISSYIISSISAGEPLITADTYGSTADSHYFRGITLEERRKVRSEMISMTAEKLLEALPLFENTGGICIVGSKEAIDLFSGDELTIDSVF
ncbi:MAG: insulinase family protein, partial [Ruminococcus sp.]|nr:insulinase family protein [Ruminococcus sp.]